MIPAWQQCEQVGVIIVDGEPVQSITYADFKNGMYLLDGQSAVVGDMLFEDAANWGDFDPGTCIVNGTGWDSDADNGGVFTSELSAILLANDGFTAVLDVVKGDGALSLYVLDSWDYNQQWYFRFDFIEAEVQLHPPGAANDQGVTIPAGINRLAITMDGTHVAASLNGGPVFTATSLEAPITQEGFLILDVTNNGAGDGYILEKAGFYPAQDDADLPGLSAL